MAECSTGWGGSEISREELAKDLDAILGQNPPTLRERFSRRHLPISTPKLPTHAFYNKHIDKQLILKRILPLDSLADDISQLVSNALAVALENTSCDQLPTEAFTSYLEATSYVKPPTAENIAELYEDGIARACDNIVTRLLIPKLRQWLPNVHWRRRLIPPPESNSGIYDNANLFLLSREGMVALPDGHRELIDSSLYEDLQRVATSVPGMGSWIFMNHSEHSDSLLAELDKFYLDDEFPYELCGTTGLENASSSPQPYDALLAPWTLPSGLGAPPVSSSKRKLRSRVQKIPPSRSITPSARRRSETTSREEVPLTAAALLQLSWARAVETDSTLIIINCGDHERVCVRHRATQTLFMSPMFNITTCKDPGYLKLHVGIHLALIKDAIARSKPPPKIISPPAEPRRSPRKRSRPDTEETTSRPLAKRHKATLDPVKTNMSTMSLASGRNMLLLHIRYDVYHSPAPASFIRAGPCLTHKSKWKDGRIPAIKRAYRHDEYFEIILGRKLGDGATGTVHTAIARVSSKNGEIILQDDLVVKLTFKRQDQARLRHEYAVYSRLAEHGVMGVPQIYGLFEDLEGGAIALVMNNCGQNLYALRPDKTKFRISVTPAQQDRFKEILSSIHRAGVRHYDIRDANLVLNGKGEAFIIDFDRGRFNPSEGKKEREMDILQELMNGIPHDFSMPSPETPGTRNEIWLRTPTPSEHSSDQEDSDEDCESDANSDARSGSDDLLL
ncbi:Protein kinase domain-containing protein [Mycena indigotica]|uniref:Protein kinase domain-containing protein n=1 Tax=Mycena indigotica TaxID=2126181 RepID=A0A8H6T1M8_9AGAR|nr:Protein kinase domain-containing protein [Mycena indigotica]KAF7309353.1 Protein kinase domain-containing protein [Mycena indigotica]